MATTTTIWVCIDCMLAAVNGETGNSEYEPLTKLAGQDYTYGIITEEHVADCGAKWSPLEECNCARDDFSTTNCEGCESPLAGERHAFTLWTK